jgi:hypothetical protein
MAEEGADPYVPAPNPADLHAASQAVKSLSELGGAAQPQLGSCATCGGPVLPAVESPGMYPYVYVLGRVEPRFPTIGIEKEFAQASASAKTEGLSDREVLSNALREHRYLARQLCWVFAVRGLDTYILAPRDPLDLERLIETLRPRPNPQDIDAVIGMRGPLAPPEMCSGLTVPIVVFDQLYSFDRESFLSSIPSPKGISREKFRPSAEELLDRIMLLADNAGATDEHRALNYLAMRYPAIYFLTSEQHQRNSSLSKVDVRRSTLNDVRTIVEVILSYTDRETDVVEKYFTRVDVTEEFPFLVTKLSPYYDH